MLKLTDARLGFVSFLLSGFSAVLLVFSYPKFDCTALVWVSLVPLFFVIDGKKYSAAFAYSYLTGMLFFLGTVYWFMHVTAVGAILLILYFAVYFGLFGLAYCYFAGLKLWIRLPALASAWVILEFARAHLLSGFGWASLGHSQYKNLALIQIADMTGVYGISFLIVSVNIVIKENLAFGWKKSRESRRDLLFLNAVLLCVLLMVYGYGYWKLAQAKHLPSLKIAVVQGNVPQDEKWVFSQRAAIIDTYLRLSEEAALAGPDLILWPETAFPGLIKETPALMERIRLFAKSSGIPIVLGVVTQQKDDYFNSALLISSEGQTVEEYDKLHLVPFGEYLPLRKQLPFLTNIVPIEDFTAGKKATVFRLPVKGQEVLFSVLICFEDTLVPIARRMVKQGAQILINMTNDAWFEDTKAPFLHMQAALFRTIETRRSLVRAANTGVSCAIDPYGRVLNYLQDASRKKTYVEGSAIFTVGLNSQVTLYTKLGDVFTQLCFVCILWANYLRRKRA